MRPAAGEATRVAVELVYGYAPESSDAHAEFASLRSRVDASLAGARLAKDRAAAALAKVMIPEALDYPI